MRWRGGVWGACQSRSKRHGEQRSQRVTEGLRHNANCLRQQGIGTPPFPFPPPGESRGGRVPPTPLARCAPAKTAVTHRCRGSPHKRGCRPPCASPRWLQRGCTLPCKPDISLANKTGQLDVLPTATCSEIVNH